MKKDHSGVEVCFELRNNSTTQEKTSESSLAQEKMVRERKRKRGEEEEEHSSDLNDAVPCIVLPFAKKSERWKEFESIEAMRKPPQHPHFSPLIAETGAVRVREWFAFALTETFIECSEKVDDMEKHVLTISELERYKMIFLIMEDHGFDVRDRLSRIDQVLSSLKDNKQESSITDKSSKEPKAQDKIINIQYKRKRPRYRVESV